LIEVELVLPDIAVSILGKIAEGINETFLLLLWLRAYWT